MTLLAPRSKPTPHETNTGQKLFQNLFRNPQKRLDRSFWLVYLCLTETRTKGRHSNMTDAYITAYKKYEAAADAAYAACKTGNAALIAMTGDACDAAELAFDAIADAK